MFPQKLSELIQKRKDEGNFRELKVFPPDFIDFFSNDYLGFVKESINQTSKSGGATGSRLISGNSKLALDLESYLANFYGSESALLFNSGYTANIGLLACIPQKGDAIFYDELIHASLRDGIRLSHAKSYTFQHNNLENLIKKLSHFKANTNYIVVESLYSMDGDLVDLHNLTKIAEEFNAYIILDEAHATGCIGKNFKGLYESVQTDRILARVHTFGKAMGTHGAAVLGNKKLKEYLINFCRSFIYTTALPKHSLNEILQMHERFSSNQNSQLELQKRIEFFKRKVNDSNLDPYFKLNSTPIQCLYSNINDLIKIEKQLLKNNIATKLIQSPTVPKGNERIRICLHSFNTKSEIEKLLKIINKWIKTTSYSSLV